MISSASGRSSTIPVQVPRRSRNGQKRLCISHYYHTVRVDYAPVLKVGKPPEEQPKTARRLRTRVLKGEVVNAVKVARKYQKFLERPEVLGYQQAAKKFGVSKPVISTYLAILNRLPTSFIEWLENCPDKLVVAFFSERRLRPVTRIEGDQEKVNVLRALLNQCLGELEEENQALERLRALLETEVTPSDSEDSSYPPPRAFRAIQLD